MADKKTVDGYIASLKGWQREAVSEIRAIVKQAAPEATEAIKWAQPVFEFQGPFAYIKPFKHHVNFGFWRGVDLKDPGKLLEGSGDKMRHVKLSRAGQVGQHRAAFQDYVRQAIELNRAKGDPTKGP